MDKAKIFWSGRSQAVRLPKSFRFDANEVTIRRHGDAVILEPITKGEWDWLKAVSGSLDSDFIEATSEDPGQAPNADFPLFK